MLFYILAQHFLLLLLLLCLSAARNNHSFYFADFFSMCVCVWNYTQIPDIYARNVFVFISTSGKQTKRERKKNKEKGEKKRRDFFPFNSLSLHFANECGDVAPRVTNKMSLSFLFALENEGTTFKNSYIR